MKMHHTRYYWIMVALILVALLLTLSEVHGQGAGAAAEFQGRPAMAGAQAGQGAQAGPPQGGLGPQGSQAAQRSIRLRRPAASQDMPQGARDEAPDGAAAADADMASRKKVAPARDPGLAKDQRSGIRQTKRAAKRTIDRARHGVSEIDSSSDGSGTAPTR